MTVWFVSRHPGALDWFGSQGIAVDCVVPHLRPDQVAEGDLVIGTLPIHLAAAVCARGARYVFLAVDLPAHLRGCELTAEQMTALGATLEEFEVRSRGPWRPLG